jgi:hypothetical protein
MMEAEKLLKLLSSPGFYFNKSHEMANFVLCMHKNVEDSLFKGFGFLLLLQSPRDFFLSRSQRGMKDSRGKKFRIAVGVTLTEKFAQR